MIKTLLEKELKTIIQSPKFVTTYVICSVLLLLSVFIGIREYRESVRQYEAEQQLSEQEMQGEVSWSGLETRTFRKPDPLQIFVSGVHFDIGRLSTIDRREAVKLTNSPYSDDPIFAVFRFIDFAFIAQIVLSLLAILFTYDAINGEKELGTLKLVFTNSISRSQYIAAKFIGAWLGLIVPLLISILLVLLMVNLYQIPLSGGDWLRLLMLGAVSCVYFTFFIAFGLLVSALTKQSSASFLIALAAWIVFVLVIPRTSVMIAGQVIPIPSVAEIEGQVDGFSKDRWDQHIKGMQQRWDKRNQEMAGMSQNERKTYRDDHLWQWMQEEDKARKQVQIDINEFSRKVKEDLRNRSVLQQRLAFTLSRFSPASAFQLAVMNIAGTDVQLKFRYVQAMQDYRTIFSDFVEEKEKESGSTGGIQIRVDSETGFSFTSPRDQGSLDLSQLPRFQHPKLSIKSIFASTIKDFGLLVLLTIATFAATFVMFLRFDVR